jgi:hypothetical protein
VRAALATEETSLGAGRAASEQVVCHLIGASAVAPSRVYAIICRQANFRAFENLSVASVSVQNSERIFKGTCLNSANTVMNRKPCPLSEPGIALALRYDGGIVPRTFVVPMTHDKPTSRF